MNRRGSDRLRKRSKPLDAVAVVLRLPKFNGDLRMVESNSIKSRERKNVFIKTESWRERDGWMERGGGGSGGRAACSHLFLGRSMNKSYRVFPFRPHCVALIAFVLRPFTSRMPTVGNNFVWRSRVIGISRSSNDSPKNSREFFSLIGGLAHINLLAPPPLPPHSPPLLPLWFDSTYTCSVAARFAANASIDLLAFDFTLTLIWLWLLQFMVVVAIDALLLSPLAPPALRFGTESLKTFIVCTDDGAPSECDNGRPLLNCSRRSATISFSS